MNANTHAVFVMTAGQGQDASKAKCYNRLFIMYIHLTVLLNGTWRHNFHTKKSKDEPMSPPG